VRKAASGEELADLQVGVDPGIGASEELEDPHSPQTTVVLLSSRGGLIEIVEGWAAV
jgi:hypothetical protein